jgi:hypothetical protein
MQHEVLVNTSHQHPRCTRFKYWQDVGCLEVAYLLQDQTSIMLESQQQKIELNILCRYIDL